jgi:hypothetical protein
MPGVDLDLAPGVFIGRQAAVYAIDRLDILAHQLKLDAGPSTIGLPARPVKPVGETPQRAAARPGRGRVQASAPVMLAGPVGPLAR